MCQETMPTQQEPCACQSKPAPEPTDDPDYRPHGRLTELTRTAAGELVARFAGAEQAFEDVRVSRCLPWSAPESLISIVDADGKELILLENLEQAPPEARELIAEELRDKHFAPRIRRVLNLEERFGFVTILAETDRGQVQFQIKGRDDVRALSETRCILKDVDGAVYEAPDVNLLDPESRRAIVELF